MSLTHPPAHEEDEPVVALDAVAVAEPRPARDVAPAPQLASADPAPVSSAHRALSLVAAVGLLWPTAAAWNGIVAAPQTGLAVIALVAGIIWLIHAIVAADDEASLVALDRWLLVAGLLVLAAWAATYLRGHDYGTDEAAFTQGAASLLIHGHNPYGAHLLGWLNTFGVNSRFLTYTMGGGVVDAYGYPALPLLIVVPFVWLTGGGQALPIADVAVLMAATAVAFRALPSTLRPLALIVAIGYPVLGNFAVSGLVEIFTMGAFTVVAARWTDIGATGRLTARDAIRGVALGLALSTNQLAWFVAPFLLVGIYLIQRPTLGRRAAVGAAGRLLAVAVGVFAIVNAPFIIWDPGAWLGGVAAPLTQHAIPYGQGLIGLTLFMRLGGGSLDAFNDSGAALYVALLVLYAARARRLGAAWMILPTAAFFVSGRSLAGYWMVLGVPMLVAVASTQNARVRAAAQLSLRAGRRVSRPALALCFVPVGACLTLALTVRSPLEMRVLSATSTPALGAVSQLRVFVHNRSAHAVTPHFSLDSSGQALGFLTIASGPRSLRAGRSALYRLRAPDSGAMSPDGTPFVVQAVSSGPRAVSSSPSFSPRGPVSNAW
jgi:uncharacterized membrane protein